MKRILAFLLAALLTAALCGCGSAPAPSSSKSDPPASTPAGSGTDSSSVSSGQAVVITSLPGTYEIAATDPHYFIDIPDWQAEGYGLGFALNENGSKGYAIVVACGYSVGDTPLEEAFPALYNDSFHGILMQNYRAKYAELSPASTETTLAKGSPALRFEDVQPADDYGTELSCPVYGYGFLVGDVPFIVAYIVMDEAADDAKCAEMKGYVDEMVNTVRAAQ